MIQNKRTKQEEEEVEQDVQYREIAETLQHHQTNVQKLRESLNHLQQLRDRISWIRDQLKMESMLPIGEGKLAFMHGELVHTNEWTILLGENYFVKCTSAKALDILNRRVKVIQENLNREQQVLNKLYDRFSGNKSVSTGAIGSVSSTGAIGSVSSTSASISSSKSTTSTSISDSSINEGNICNSSGSSSSGSSSIDAKEELRRSFFETLEEYKREDIVEIREEYNEEEETRQQQEQLRKQKLSDNKVTESKPSVNWNELTALLNQMQKEAAERGGEEEEEENEKYNAQEMDLRQKLLKMEEEKLKSKQQETMTTMNPIIKQEVVEELSQEFAKYFHISSQKQNEKNMKFASDIAATRTATTTAITEDVVAQKPATLPKAVSVGQVVERIPVVQTQQQQQPQTTQAKKKVSKFKQMLQSQQQQ